MNDNADLGSRFMFTAGQNRSRDALFFVKAGLISVTAAKKLKFNTTNYKEFIIFCFVAFDGKFFSRVYDSQSKNRSFKTFGNI